MPKKQITNEDLARMIKKGFDDNDKRCKGIDKRFDVVYKRFDRVESRLENIENGQEEIKLKLNQVAYRFEVEDLDRRLRKVEIKLGLRKG